ncbi:MAG: Do family serine endopeptidase [Pseudomonadota bacterium]
MLLRFALLFVLAFGAPNAAGQTPVPQSQVPQSQGEITLSFAPVVRAAAPAVVNIYTRKLVSRRASPFAGDPFFERFFGDFFPEQGGRQRRIENSLGSGVIVDAGGIVVSNHHVVGEADEITVVLNDRREFDAEVIFTDEETDLAVLRLMGAEALPVLALRDSDTLEVGDLVLAIGNPFGVGQTVTSGIVSGLARRGATRGDGGYFIQTDAAINPGNSGGALVDVSGRLVGVNTAILSRSGGSNGIGFAVPANLVARVIEAARAGEETLVRPWLGLTAQEVTAGLAEALGLDRPGGVLVGDLHPASPLGRAGLEAGDVIVALDEGAVDALAELEFRAATLGVGREASVTYLRRGEERSAPIRLAPAPEAPPRDRRQLRQSGRLSGLTVVTVNPAVIEEARLPATIEGVRVVGLAGPARRSGLRPGDVVTAVNGRPVATSAAFMRAVQVRSVELEVLRGGRRGTVTVRNG